MFIDFSEGTTAIILAQHPAQFQMLHGTVAEASESSRYQTLPQCTEAVIILMPGLNPRIRIEGTKIYIKPGKVFHQSTEGFEQ